MGSAEASEPRMKTLTTLLIVAALALPATAAAQDQVDVSKMGVSLERIRRDLVPDARERVGGSPLNLQIHVEVFGRAPEIDFLEGFDVSGPVSYGPPTHREVLDVLTPREFRSPVMPLSAIAVQAAQWLSQRSQKSRCEAELAEYRALVMQGVNVAAPRCSP